MVGVLEVSSALQLLVQSPVHLEACCSRYAALVSRGRLEQDLACSFMRLAVFTESALRPAQGLAEDILTHLLMIRVAELLSQMECNTCVSMVPEVPNQVGAVNVRLGSVPRTGMRFSGSFQPLESS